MFKPQKNIVKGRRETITISLPAAMVKDVKNYIDNAIKLELIDKNDMIQPQDVIYTLVDGFVKAQEVKELETTIKQMKEEKAAKAKAEKEMKLKKKQALLEEQLAKVKQDLEG